MPTTLVVRWVVKQMSRDTCTCRALAYTNAEHSLYRNARQIQASRGCGLSTRYGHNSSDSSVVGGEAENSLQCESCVEGVTPKHACTNARYIELLQ